MKNLFLTLGFSLLLSISVTQAVSAEDYSMKNSVEGFSYKDLVSYKNKCPSCVAVAEDIITLRNEVCGQSLTVDDIIVKDAMFGYLNSLNNILDKQTYSTVLRVAGQEKDCHNSLNWTILLHKRLEQ